MGFGYRNGIGEIIWAMISARPDMSYACIRSSQYSACPAEIHYHGVRNALKYLCQTKDDGIIYWRPVPNEHLPYVEPPTITANAHELLLDGRPKDEPLTRAGWSDSEWASCPKTRRSFTGAVARLAGGTVGYKSKLQPTVAGSSTESEFMGAGDTGKMLLYIRSVMYDLGVPQDAATILYEDNDACTTMANAQKPTPRTRHIDIKWFSLAEWVERDLLKLERVDTTQNMADHFTKQLGPLLFSRHCDYLMGRVPPTYSAAYRRLYGQLKDTLPPPIPTRLLRDLPTKSPIAAAAAKFTIAWARVLGLAMA